MGFTELKDSQAFLVFILGGINGLAYHFFVSEKLSIYNLFNCLYFNIILISSTIFIFGNGTYLENILYYLILYIYPCMQKISYQKTVKSYATLNNGLMFPLFTFVLILVFSSAAPTTAVFNVLTFAELYDVRMQSRETLSETSTLVNYSYMLAFKVIAPIILSYGLLKGKTTLVFASLVIFLMGFAISAHKSILLTPIAMILLFYCIKRSLNIKLAICNSVLVLSLISCFSSGTVQLVVGDVLTRRVFLVPGMLTDMYFTYFSTSDFNLFSSIREKFSDERTTSLAFRIGGEVFGRSEMSANAGFVASGYAEAGVLGVIIYAALILFVFMWLESKDKLEKNLYLLAAFPILLAILETNLTTIFLTHGLVFLILVKFLWKIKHV